MLLLAKPAREPFVGISPDCASERELRAESEVFWSLRSAMCLSGGGTGCLADFLQPSWFGRPRRTCTQKFIEVLFGCDSG